MKLETYTAQEIMDMPIDQLKELNEHWRTAIKQHWNLWTYELLKKNPRHFDDFLLAQEELKELHFQFRWEQTDWQQRLIAKNPSIKRKDIQYYQYDPRTDQAICAKDFWDGSE